MQAHPEGRRASRRAALVAVLALSLVAAGASSASASASSDAGRGTPAPGTPGVGDPVYPFDGNGGYDALHYSVSITIGTKARWIHGRTVVDARATQDLSRFDLDLNGLTVRSVTVDGVPATWRRWGHELVITPATDLADGQTFRTEVRYAGRPEIVVTKDGFGNGWFRTKDGVSALGEPPGTSTWMAVNEHPSDKATYDVTATVRRGLTAVSNGLPVGPPTSHERWTTWRWRAEHPMPSYNVLLTVGRYDVWRSTGPHGLPIIDAVDSSVGRAPRRALAREPEILRVLERAFGPYPFEAAGGVVDPSDVGYALETATRPFYPADEFDGSVWDTSLLAHELAHQWFGDSVSLERWHDIWLNEGFATYAEWVWADHEGLGTPHESFQDLKAIPATDGFWDLDISRPSAAHLFDDPVYERGAMVLQALREQIGSRTFFRTMRTWARSHRDGNGTTAQFIALAEHISGQQLDDVFDAWLFGAGKPTL